MDPGAGSSDNVDGVADKRRSGVPRSGSDRSGADWSNSDQSGSDRSGADRSGTEWGLSIEAVTKSFPGSGRVLEAVDLQVPGGTSLALLGPSGCGKTTLLRVIAGLEPPDAGVVRLGDQVLVDDTHSVPPEQRRIGMVFQNWALFSHLSVGRNVGFGLPRSERRSSGRIDEALGMVGLSQMTDRSTDTLSGGQQQRVALARALAPRPRVLLLDEPFSNLDATLRSSVRTEVRSLLDELDVTSIFVTHDQDEAFVLGDRIAVMSEGRVIQVGTPVEVYERPANRWVAGFVGEANFVPAVATAGSDVAASHPGQVRAELSRVETPFGVVSIEGPAAGEVDVLVRPERFCLGPMPEHGDPQSATATVSAVEYLGHSTRYLLDWQDATLIARELFDPRFSAGDRVIVSLAEGTYCAFEPGDQ